MPNKPIEGTINKKNNKITKLFGKKNKVLLRCDSNMSITINEIPSNSCNQNTHSNESNDNNNTSDNATSSKNAGSSDVAEAIHSVLRSEPTIRDSEKQTDFSPTPTTSYGLRFEEIRSKFERSNSSNTKQLRTIVKTEVEGRSFEEFIKLLIFSGLNDAILAKSLANKNKKPENGNILEVVCSMESMLSESDHELVTTSNESLDNSTESNDATSYYEAENFYMCKDEVCIPKSYSTPVWQTRAIAGCRAVLLILSVIYLIYRVHITLNN